MLFTGILLLASTNRSCLSSKKALKQYNTECIASASKLYSKNRLWFFVCVMIKTLFSLSINKQIFVEFRLEGDLWMRLAKSIHFYCCLKLNADVLDFTDL